MRAPTALVVIALGLSASCAQSSELPLVVHAGNGGAPFVGDGPLVVTVSPNGDGYRDTAVIRYRVSTGSFVRFDVGRHGAAARALASSHAVKAGDHVYRWAPPARPVPAAYRLHITAGKFSATVVVHVQGVDAAAG